MTLCKGKILFHNLLFHQKNCRFFSLTHIKTARYEKSFVDPIVDKDILSQPVDELDERRFQPIKAARTDQSSAFYYDTVVQQFINMMMKDGRKEPARNALEKAFENVKRIQLEKYHKATTEAERASLELDPLKIFHKAVDNCKPVLYTQNMLRGGVKYKVPVPCPSKRQSFQSMKWLIESCRDVEKRRRMYIKLAHELVDASNNEGKAIRKKQELHRLCEENRAYAHFRWK